jgi:hypothetical protein
MMIYYFCIFPKRELLWGQACGIGQNSESRKRWGRTPSSAIVASGTGAVHAITQTAPTLLGARIMKSGGNDTQPPAQPITKHP